MSRRELSEKGDKIIRPSATTSMTAGREKRAFNVLSGARFAASLPKNEPHDFLIIIISSAMERS